MRKVTKLLAFFGFFRTKYFFKMSGIFSNIFVQKNLNIFKVGLQNQNNKDKSKKVEKMRNKDTWEACIL